MTDIQWDQPLEAVHRDSGAVARSVMLMHRNYAGSLKVAIGSIVVSVSDDGFHAEWRIRNRTDIGTTISPQQTPTPDVMGIAPELVERMVELVRRMALADKAEFMAMGTGCREAYAEADAIVALLPEPVDGLERLINIAMNSGDTAKEIAETIRSSPDVWSFITAKAS